MFCSRITIYRRRGCGTSFPKCIGNNFDSSSFFFLNKNFCSYNKKIIEFKHQANCNNQKSKNNYPSTKQLASYLYMDKKKKRDIKGNEPGVF